MEMAAKAIECFRRQGYREKELVVVSQDDVSALGVPFHLAPKDVSLGDLRNFCVARAKGRFVAQWDDDDWYHPDRLERQIAHLLGAGDVAGCTLTRWTMAWPAKGRYALSAHRQEGFEGSLVGYRWKLPCYPAARRSEDFALLRNLPLTTLDEPDLYVYQVHYANTWNQEHFDILFERASRTLDPEETRRVKERLGLTA